MSFTNRQLVATDLPQLLSLQLSSVRHDYPGISLMVLLGFYLIFGVGLGLGFMLIPGIAQLWSTILVSPLMAILPLVMLGLAFYTYAYAKSLAYGIREHDIVLRSGVFWKREIVQPLRRVQHVELSCGPVDKRFNLVKVKLFSAGTAMSTFVIPGLDKNVGSQIKQYVLDYQDGIVKVVTASTIRTNEQSESARPEVDTGQKLSPVPDQDDDETH